MKQNCLPQGWEVKERKKSRVPSPFQGLEDLRLGPLKSDTLLKVSPPNNSARLGLLEDISDPNHIMKCMFQVYNLR